MQDFIVDCAWMMGGFEALTGVWGLWLMGASGLMECSTYPLLGPWNSGSEHIGTVCKWLSKY
jgi:hypothetical protein